jgi:hypothetical protein
VSLRKQEIIIRHAWKLSYSTFSLFSALRKPLKLWYVGQTNMLGQEGNCFGVLTFPVKTEDTASSILHKFIMQLLDNM